MVKIKTSSMEALKICVEERLNVTLEDAVVIEMGMKEASILFQKLSEKDDAAAIDVSIEKSYAEETESKESSTEAAETIETKSEAKVDKLLEVDTIEEATLDSEGKPEKQNGLNPRQRGKKPTEKERKDRQNEIFNYIKGRKNGIVKTIEIIEGNPKYDRNKVKYILEALQKEGKITKIRRGTWKLVSESEEKQEVENREDEKQQQETEKRKEESQKQESEKGKEENTEQENEKQIQNEEDANGPIPDSEDCEETTNKSKIKELIKKFPQYNIIKYIFTRRTFIVEKLRKRQEFFSRDEEITQIIRICVDEGWIQAGDDETDIGKYTVNFETIIWWYLYVELKRRAAFSVLLAKIQLQKNEIEEGLRNGIAKGIIKREETYYYKAL